MRLYFYDKIETNGSRYRLGMIEDPYDSPLTEVDKYFEQQTGTKATERGVVVWWQDIIQWQAQNSYACFFGCVLNLPGHFL